MNVLKRLNNPVLFNEWKMRMRSVRSPWMLFFYLMVLGAITLFYIYVQTDGGTYYNPDNSRELFMILSILQLGMIVFVVPGLTSGSISGERERQTLSILLTTNVSATRLILGKWLASLSFMMFLVFATIPLYAIVFLYGGVSPVQLVKVFGFYVITMFAIGSVGVLLSTLIKRTGIATVVSYAVVFGYSIGTMVMVEILNQFVRYQRRAGVIGHNSNTDWIDLIYSFNPLFAILNIFEEGPATRGNRYGSSWLYKIDPYWYYCALLGLITVIFLLVAIYLIQPVRPRLFRAAKKEQ
ncbi:ABC transporter permease [Brevibacillus panacihumi]|uniref:ABC transporter permease n=1 Tax=Brevibacillus panacihumi TaxID=497735 RepID=UPI003D1BAECC